VSVFVKICGLSDAAAVHAAVAAKADAIGFVFHKPSKRYVTPEHAASLCAGISSSVIKVAVARTLEAAELETIIGVFKPDVVQLDWSATQGVKFPKTIDVLPVCRETDVIEQLPSKFLWEGKESGVGHAVDWDHAAHIARQAQMILAGGLDPINVAKAISIVNPFGVDVSSGVENEYGQKDLVKIAAFVENAKNAQSVK